jgi:hypothetical protein
MKTSKLLRNWVSFTTSLAEDGIETEQVVAGLHLGLGFVQDGATAPTLATMLGSLDFVTINASGMPPSRILGEDIYALDNLWFGKRPIHVIPAGDNQTGGVLGLYVPVWANAKERRVSYSIGRTDITTTDGETISVLAELTENQDPAGQYILETIEYTPASTGASLKAASKKLDGDLEGILLFGTTIPTTTNMNASIKEITIKLPGGKEYEAEWSTLGAMGSAGSIADASIPEGILDNYRVIDFRNEPVPAGETIEIFTKADAADACRFVLIQRRK